MLILKHEKQTDLETWRASYRNLCILYVHITVFNVFIVFSPFYISDLTTCYDVVCPADGDISGFSLDQFVSESWYWCLSDQSCLNKKKMTQNQQHHFDPGLKFRSDVFKKLAHHSYNLSHKHCGIGWIEGITEILKYILHNILKIQSFIKMTIHLIEGISTKNYVLKKNQHFTLLLLFDEFFKVINIQSRRQFWWVYP